MNFRLLVLVVCLLLPAPLSVYAVADDPDDQLMQDMQQQTRYNIGIVTDGNTPVDRKTIALFQKEIQTLAEEEFMVKFPQSMILSGRNTAKGVDRALDRLLANPNTDLILTLGTIASSEALHRKKLTKPVVAPFVLDSVVQELSPAEGSESTPNFTYIDAMYYMDEAVLTLQKIVPFKSLAILIDQRELTAIPEISKFVRKLANEHTMKVTAVPVNTSAAEVLAAIPADTGAVMVGLLYSMSVDEQKLLLNGLIERRLPGYTLWNRQLVDEGLLAGDVPADMDEKLARRSAVSVQDILLGEDAESLEIAFSRGHDLTINMATARALDVYPSLAVLTGANLLNEERADIERHLTLQQAVSEALQANLDLSSSQLRVQAGVHAVTEARSPLLPQISVATGARAIDEDRAGLGGGVSPERAWTGSAGGYQQIYSERSWAGYTAEKYRQSGREMDHETVRLNVMYEASTAYFNVLRAKTIERLNKENLKLTQANLDRARIRLSTGVSGPDEVYRWETKYATDKFTVLEKESFTMSAMEAMNRILNRPLQELFIAEETDLSDPLLIVGDELFFSLVNNPKYFQEFRLFAVQEALTYRSELKSLDASISARDRLKTAAGREFWLPEFSVEGEVEQYFSEDGAGQRDEFHDGLDDTDWQIGVFARLPLFEGGRKSGALNRIRKEVARLKVERRASADRVAQDILSALNKTRASYPGISLSREAADAARRNLQLITDSYVQGIKSIIDLLDAQNQALTADQAAANSVYNFLIDLMGVQRAMGEFVIFLPEQERKAWRERAEVYLQQKAKPVADS
jgi:outer membrane protein TolC